MRRALVLVLAVLSADCAIAQRPLRAAPRQPLATLVVSFEPPDTDVTDVTSRTSALSTSLFGLAQLESHAPAVQIGRLTFWPTPVRAAGTRATLKRYWPVWSTLAWIAGYEIYAGLTGKQTWSQMIWQGGEQALLLGTAVVGLLLIHLWAH